MTFTEFPASVLLICALSFLLHLAACDVGVGEQSKQGVVETLGVDRLGCPIVNATLKESGGFDYSEFCGPECEPVFGYDWVDRGDDISFEERWFLACLHRDLERRYTAEEIDPTPDYLCIVGKNDAEEYLVSNPLLTAFMAMCWLPCSYEDPESQQSLVEAGWLPRECVSATSPTLQ